MKKLVIVLVSMGLIAGAFQLINGLQYSGLPAQLLWYTVYIYLGLYWIRALIKEK